VSLWWHRRAITRAVAGDLAAEEVVRLRAHLTGCDPCRAFYDDLARVAEALDGGRAAAAAERTRLVAALETPAAVAAPARPPRRWVVAALALAPAAAVIVAWRARPRQGSPAPLADDDVTLRGVAEATAPAAGPTLLVHARRRPRTALAERVRLVAELPGSGELRLFDDDDVQLGVRGLRAPAYVRAYFVDGRGVAHAVAPRPGASALVRPAPGVVSLGPSFHPGREGVERGRLVAFFSSAELDEARASAAAERLDAGKLAAIAAELRAQVVTGVIMVQP
jgi:hypothetical protein